MNEPECSDEPTIVSSLALEPPFAPVVGVLIPLTLFFHLPTTCSLLGELFFFLLCGVFSFTGVWKLLWLGWTCYIRHARRLLDILLNTLLIELGIPCEHIIFEFSILGESLFLGFLLSPDVLVSLKTLECPHLPRSSISLSVLVFYHLSVFWKCLNMIIPRPFSHAWKNIL